jgi:hypothetical protein
MPAELVKPRPEGCRGVRVVFPMASRCRCAPSHIALRAFLVAVSNSTFMPLIRLESTFAACRAIAQTFEDVGVLRRLYGLALPLQTDSQQHSG